MFRGSYQRGLLTIFFSCGSKPLKIWDTYTQDGYITKFLDEDIRSTVLEIGGTNVSTTYMICPKGKQVLGITMPFLVMIVKNLKKYFSFEVTILDDTGTRRRFRVSNFQSTTQILPLCTVMPIALSDGWNQIQFNMSDFCRRAYQKQFVEVQKCKINANIRVRRIYFADRIFPEEKLPPEYKLFIPLKKRPAKDKLKTDQEVLALDKQLSAELKRKDSKTASQVQEKKLSKVLLKAASQVPITTEVGVAAAEGAATTEPGATAQEPAAEAAAPADTGETPPTKEAAVGETLVTEGADAGETPVAEGAAPGETPVTEGADAGEIIFTVEAATGEIPVTEEAATETTEPVKEKSETATQNEPVSAEDKATDAAELEGKTPSAGRLETIAENE